ncbi:MULTISPECIES: D-aminoacyl-tRNA deacylase [Crateriforma]|uniref:D-aminoacyl-tRNA deacylase n=1 Tax=Crateriforma conspicua TaxID=2527996 RepID=A0A5C6FUM4_9PLAN|nr:MULTISPECIES: D-aminoacyl-tRNA deacylase [Crateriforma]TWU65188.1 D-tyrosyl-tRNA(Tyr) deacylase [Crateriforma conspicua]
MRLVIQRVTEATVSVDGKIVGRCGPGLMILVGVGQGDQAEHAEWLAKKCAELRIFDDSDGKMNQSILDIGGSALAISQFTLLGDCRKGRRPGFTDAADPAIANELYQHFVHSLVGQGVPTETGIFAADMKVALTNDGPVTFILERD